MKNPYIQKCLNKLIIERMSYEEWTTEYKQLSEAIDKLVEILENNG